MLTGSERIFVVGRNSRQVLANAVHVGGVKHDLLPATEVGPDLSLLKTEFLDKNLLWQQQNENCALESEGTSGQRRDVQRLLKRAWNFRQESCRQIAASNQWRPRLGLGVILQAARCS